ncbi:MAG TPA: STAS/SEC14 domain-containing protein [Terriglobales bacterium]|nr:STAS/SEC14 domain-containing protein [Terriglobales bacterium]
MKDRIRYISHKGKKILLMDCTDCSVDEVEKLARFVPQYVTKHPKGSLLLLADFTGAKFHKRIMDAVKEGIVLDRPYLKRSAWVGIDGLPKVFYEHLKSFSQRELPTFATREEALEWLVQE